MLIVYMPCRRNANSVHALPGNVNSIHALSENVDIVDLSQKFSKNFSLGEQSSRKIGSSGLRKTWSELILKGLGYPLHDPDPILQCNSLYKYTFMSKYMRQV